MASTSWPTDANGREVSQVQYEGLLSGYTLDGFTGWTSSTPAPCYADGTGGLVAKMRAGATAQGRGHGYAVGDVDVPVTIAANSAGSTRIDRIVLQLDRSGTGKWSLVETAIQGTAGSGQPPALTRDYSDSGKYQIPVARVNVAPGATALSASDVFFEGQYVSPSGFIICTRNSRPFDVMTGVQMFETDTNRVFVGNGSDWKPIIEDSGWISLSLNNVGWQINEIAPKIRRYNGKIYVSGGSIQRKSGLSGGNDSSVFHWPRTFGFPGIDPRRASSYTTGANIADINYYPISNPGRANWCYIRGHVAMSTGDAIFFSDTDWIPATDDYWS